MITSTCISLFFLITTTITSTVIFTIYDTSHDLRELIGSIHKSVENQKVIVFGYSQVVPKDEITLWRHVRFVDIQQEIKYSTDPEVSTVDKDNDILKFYLFEYVFEEELVDKAIFIESGYLFDKELLRIDNGHGIGYEVYDKIEGYKNLVKSKLANFRGIAYRTSSEVKVSSYSVKTNTLNLTSVSNNSKFSCSIKVRSELVFSGLLSNHSNHQVKYIKNQNISIALLVPTKNENDKVEDCPILKYLITSIKDTTITTADHLNDVTLYIGYDVDDPVFKYQSKREYLINNTPFKVKFYELPKTKWLTFIWNFLFVEAFKDENDYFIQLNDDVKFLKSGWLSSSISMLPLEKGGVIGFNDKLWNCDLYTQTLVNRNHYKIFKGQYFPLSLRNWYSDNWITSVYKDNGAANCNKDALISNSNVETRYEPCDSSNYESALKEGKKLMKR